jgi:serine/threonine-protein kinase
LIEEKGKIDYSECVKFAADIVRALEACHKNNIIHRDVKPDNLCISKDGSLRLIDFGLAKYVNEQSLAASLAQLDESSQSDNDEFQM